MFDDNFPFKRTRLFYHITASILLNPINLNYKAIKFSTKTLKIKI